MDGVRRILICGGRDYADKSRMSEVIHALFNPDTDTIMHGGARGADTLAGEIASELGCAAKVYPADWKTHGKAAGAIRNQIMLDDGKPNIVVAFPGGKGTADMVKRAKRAGIWVIQGDTPTGGEHDQ